MEMRSSNIVSATNWKVHGSQSHISGSRSQVNGNNISLTVYFKLP